jgi:hypothetical protein
MSARLVRPLAGAAVAVLAAAPLAAQSRSVVELTPYAGYMVFGDYADGPVGSSIANANGTILGAQLALTLTPNVALVGHLGRASADLEVGLPVLGGVDVGNSSVWLYDANLQFSAGTLGAGGVGVSPFLQVGAGGARHQLSGVGGLVETDATNFTFNAGLGADLMLSRSVGLRLMAKDYVGRFDVEEASTLDRRGDLAHNLAFSAGLKLAF